MNRINLLKIIDAVAGHAYCHLFPQNNNPVVFSHRIRHILIIRPGGIGDAVLTIPLIQAIKKSYPDVKIDILAEKRNYSIYALCVEIRNLYLYDRPKHLVAAIRNTYDVIIDTEQWHRLSVVVARRCNAGTLIGFSTNERGRLLTHPIPYSHADYEVASFLNLLTPLGIESPPSPEYPFISIPADLVDNIACILRPLSGKDFIALFPGASISEKRWDSEKFVTLAEKLNEIDFAVVTLGAASEKRSGDMIVAGRCGINLAGSTSLLETAAVIQKSRMLISGDSGVLHIAAGLGVPTVSLFGPSNTMKWAPKGKQHVAVSRNLPCSPCSKFGYTPKCSIQAKCMADITVDDVMAAVDRVLGMISSEKYPRTAGEDPNEKG